MSKQQNSWSRLVPLVFNVLLPLLIMTRLNGADALGPVWALIIALLFPLIYGIVEWYKAKKTSLFSVVGLISILLTGGIGLLEIPAERVAIKEAGIPLLLGVGILIAIRVGYPVAKVFVLQALDQDAIDASLLGDEVKQKKLIRMERNMSYVFAGSFFLSAVMNYVLAVRIVTAQPGTEEFTAQIGTMTGLSFPVIALPLMIILMVAVGYMMWKIVKLTGLGLEELVPQ